MRRIGFCIVALLAASGLAACSSSSSGGGNTQPTSGTSSTPTSSSFDKAVAQQTAQSAVLTLSDLPTGWTSSPSSDSPSDQAVINNGLASCLGVPSSVFASEGPNKVEVASPDFSAPGGSSQAVSEHVDVETSSEISAEFAVVNSPKLVGCMQSVYGPFLKAKFASDPHTKSYKIGTVSAVRGNIPTYGDQSAGIEITVPISIGKISAKAIVDLIFVRVGNLAAQLSFEGTNKAFDTATAASITTTATNKLKAAAG